ncbi:MAG: permease-like cell division protein FtsX [Alistipes sp.]|nr:permease-like cell division protein FtsX [Alistipes sp.]
MKNNTALKRRVLRSYTVSTVSIALVLFVLGAIGYIMASVFTTAQSMREGVTMIVELKDGLSEPQRDTLSAQIATSEQVVGVRFVSKEDKLADEEFRAVFDVDIEGILGENPLPDTFDVTLSAASADKEAREAFVEELESREEITRVSYPEQLLERVHNVLDTMQLLLLLFGGAMLVISLILLNNTIRLAIFSRREVINTMKLVGATKWFIMRPFLNRSALQGLIAGVLATLLFAATLCGLAHTMPELGIVIRIEELGIIAAALVGVGVVVAVLFTLFAVNKFVNMKSNKIYLY